MVAPNYNLPSLRALENISPTASENVQPEWIRQQFPDYVDNHLMHDPLTSVRAFDYEGHQVRITTTYLIEVDGVSIHPHALVDDTGRLFSHAMPFETYGSATDFVKSLLKSFPDYFAQISEHSHHEDEQLHSNHSNPITPETTHDQTQHS